jgi:predicted DNA repair protein MutK
MAGSSLLALIDDIATLLDDVSVMTKVATQKTAGVLGDDLALNAQQVAGVAADRELPVVWAVAKGSTINKMILVPAALAISALEFWLHSKGINIPLITPLMMVGGAFLCFEGVEKIAHKFLHDDAEEEKHHKDMLKALVNDADLVAFEKDKIKGAIRTDFILSAEIIVITLGTVANEAFSRQITVLTLISIIMTIGVYGLVAGIVKLDDGGVYLLEQKGVNAWARFKQSLGKLILWFAPFLMKTLSIAGTAAMFLVGGSILVHSIPAVHHVVQDIAAKTGGMATLMTWVGDAVVGILAGIVVLLAVLLFKKVFARKKPAVAPQ